MYLREFIEHGIAAHIDHLHSYAMRNPDYAKVFKAKLEDLPPMMDASNELLSELIAAKLRGKDIAASRYTQKAMWDQEFDMDDIRSISFNDGQSCTLAEIADLSDWEDLAMKARDCIYYD